ncbi:unnamed protein product [Prorocentrum cordatum]|uniref:Cilia- and flagella-associated protein 91 n=1 Tax=Prorocentrum cordatum TaxID=2364126 RepID=A0ABN9TQU2_9DINO|nr:unnamed protein product [Polarella glacialis]
MCSPAASPAPSVCGEPEAPLLELPEPQHKEPVAGIFSSWCVLTNTLLGVGLLGLPWAVSTVGLALGATMLWGAGLLAAFALHLLSVIAIALTEGSQGPADITFYGACCAVAPCARHVVDAAIAVKCFGVATSYLQVVGQIGAQLVLEIAMWDTSQEEVRRCVIAFVACAVIAPTVFHKRITKTASQNLFAISAWLYVVVLVVLYSLSLLPAPPPPAAGSGREWQLLPPADLDLRAVATSLPIFIFSFTCHQNLFSIATELRGRTVGRLDLILVAGAGAGGIIYSFAACGGYMRFGRGLGPNFLLDLPDSLLLLAGRGLVMIAVVFTYPLQLHPCRRSVMILAQNVQGRFFHRREERYWRRGTTVAILLGSVALASAFQELGITLAIVGAVGSNTIALIMPAFLYLRLSARERERGGAGLPLRLPALGLLLVGCTILPVCLGGILWKILDPAPRHPHGAAVPGQGRPGLQDPFSPEYFVRPDQVPEVLSLTNLTYGAGLPATEAELAIIERTRQKRLFVQMLPPPTDEQNMEIRMQLMEAQEFRDWADRERQIRELQEKRLVLLQRALEERDGKREKAQEDKVERVRQKKEEERDCKLATCQRDRIKVLRKVQKERKAAEARQSGLPKGRDVIQDYADTTSQVYAPLARNGHVPDYNTAKIEVQPADLQTYAGLTQLEQALPPSLLRASDRHPKDAARKAKSSHQVRKELEMANALKSAMESIKKELQAPSESDAPGRAPGDASALGAGTKKAMRIDRPDSPRLKEDVLPEEEEQETAVLLLQRIIRGRAYQNQMFEGKETRLDLINELRAAERYAETATTVEEKRYIGQLYEKAFEGALESAQGSVISQTLDQLSKELLRFQEERRIAAMVKLAERDRQYRQAQESGRRQAEERLREREDEMFRQIMGVHQGTVDSYLEEVLTDTVEQAAQSRALTEARLKAGALGIPTCAAVLAAMATRVQLWPRDGLPGQANQEHMLFQHRVKLTRPDLADSGPAWQEDGFGVDAMAPFAGNGYDYSSWADSRSADEARGRQEAADEDAALAALWQAEEAVHQELAELEKLGIQESPPGRRRAASRAAPRERAARRERGATELGLASRPAQNQTRAEVVEVAAWKNPVTKGLLGLTAAIIGGFVLGMVCMIRGASQDAHFGPPQIKSQPPSEASPPQSPFRAAGGPPGSPPQTAAARRGPFERAALDSVRPTLGPCPSPPGARPGGGARSGGGPAARAPAPEAGPLDSSAGSAAPAQHGLQEESTASASSGGAASPGGGRGGAAGVLCEELVVPEGWEIVFVLPEVITAQRQETSFDILSSQGEPISRVLVDERRPGAECCMRVEQADGRPMGIVRTDAVHKGRGGMPQICRPDGSVFGTLSREDDSARTSRYALRGQDGRLLLVFKGDFRSRRVSVLSPSSGQKVCVVERARPVHGAGPRYQAKVWQGTDTSVVLCGLLAIDKVEGSAVIE